MTVALHSVHVNKEHWKVCISSHHFVFHAIGRLTVPQDPYTFNPERWGTDEVKKRHKNAYIPFATGARGCIGFNFALQEMKIVLSRLVLGFDFEDVTDGAVVYDPAFSLYRPLNFKAKAHARPDPRTRTKGEEEEAKAKTIRAKQKPEVVPKVGQRELPTLYVLVSVAYLLTSIIQSDGASLSMEATMAPRRASHQISCCAHANSDSRIFRRLPWITRFLCLRTPCQNRLKRLLFSSSAVATMVRILMVYSYLSYLTLF